MGQFYQDLDRVGGFDYELQTLDGFAEHTFRGPPVDTEKPFLACIGAAQTFGRFVADPYPALLGRRLGLPVLNLGVGGAGPRHFDKPRYLALINKAEAVVVQVMSGRSASSSLFDNSAHGGLFGATALDKAPVRSEEVLARAAQTMKRHEFAKLIEEMRADYVAAFARLLDKINVPRLLLWLSKRTPEYVEDYSSLPGGVMGDFPHLVNRRMVAEVAARCDGYLECASTTGLPQKLWAATEPLNGAVLRRETLENRYYPSPEMHAEAADLLEAPCRRFLGRPASPKPQGPRRFLMVGAERTGTNLLIGLLNQHAGCFCGGELFNSGVIARGKLPWFDLEDAERDRLLELRLSDPLRFLAEIEKTATDKAYEVVGFKLLYGHGQSQPEVMEALSGDLSLPVIHVTRRNLLRRLVSERQAREANKWAVGRGAEPPERRHAEIAFDDLVGSLARTERGQALFEQKFAGHPVLRIVYEDLAARPLRVAARAAEFLGLPPPAKPPFLNYRKTGAEALSEALTGGDELRAKLRRWATFFDE